MAQHHDMHRFFSFLIDFLFPPSKEAIALRALSPREAVQKFPASAGVPLPFITCLFSYKDPLVSELIHGIKNKKDPHCFKVAGYSLFEKLPGGILVPVPLSKKRRKERGYNQCELIIEEILKLDTENKFTKDFNLLERTKHTGEQKLKNRKERLESSENVFKVSAAGPLGTPIIIIDDVTTTGSTLNEARNAFLKAGYINVRAFTLAH